MTDTSAPRWDNFYIGGKWVAPEGDEKLEVFDSTDGSLLGVVPAGVPADVDNAVAAARAAFEEWSQVSGQERAAVLDRVADLIDARGDELADLLVRETGSTLSIARAVQVGNPVEFTRIAAEEARSTREPERIGHSLVVREPIGVVGCIGPWNYPLNQIVKKAMFAIAAGCTTVVKPSEVAPLDVFLLAELADQAGLPPGVLNVVCGYGHTVGERISAHPDIDMVSFTGSTAAGKRVAAAASGNVKKVALELGGKSALIVLDDLDQEEFARAVTSAVSALWMNSGQTCAALTRLLVPRSRLAEAEQVAADVADSTVVGDPFDPDVKVGPLASAEHRDRVLDYIRVGIDEGARVLAGGATVPEHLAGGYYVTPTVFTEVEPTMRIAREEIFGPVLAIIAYDDEDDAVRIANDSEYGLSGGVWSATVERSLAVAARMRTGSVRINGAPANSRAPFGGYKQSGIGREYGRYGYEEFLEIKSVHLPS